MKNSQPSEHNAADGARCIRLCSAQYRNGEKGSTGNMVETTEGWLFRSPARFRRIMLSLSPSTADFEPGTHARRLRLDTAHRAALDGHCRPVRGDPDHLFLARFELPVTLAFVVVAASAWLNVGLRLRYPVNYRLDDGPAALLLGYDILQLSCLLYLTGGLQNPFALLFPCPCDDCRRFAVHAQDCSPAGADGDRGRPVLAFFHLPLPWYAGKTLEMPCCWWQGCGSR